MNITAEQAARSHDTKSDLMLGVSVTLMVLGSVLVGLRLWCRSLIRSAGWDDIAAVLTLVSIISNLSKTIKSDVQLLGLFDSLRDFGGC
jgi:uncharacterized protein (DUF983 family)